MHMQKTVVLCDADVLSAEKTFQCGQCFRWNPQADGSYIGIASGHPARVRCSQQAVILEMDDPAHLPFWTEYFDLGRDYEAIRGSFPHDPYFDACAEYGKGIRILRQEPWEALCSFILSQCNNITRIQQIVERLCCLYGEPVSFAGRTLYTFPGAAAIARLSAEDLNPLRSGYRAPYVLEAARAVESGALDLTALAQAPFEEAVSALCRLNGVGKKVANCVALFGLHNLSGFPVDTWMRKALRDHFSPDFDPGFFGSYAGLAQQYIFFYARSMGRNGA